MILGLGFLLLATQKLPLLVWIFLSLTAWYLGNYLENTLNLEKQKLALEDAYEGEVRRLRSIYKNSELQFLTREEKAILQERNRIAGEIHDTVGHQLTGAILQLSALEVSGEENALLTDLRERLEQALQDIRQAVHAMHDTSLNIADRLETLAAGYRFCPVHIQVNIQDQPSPSLYYFFVLTAQEALQNTAKHSNADRFDISLRQYGDRYLYLLRDNGSTAQPSTEIYPLKHASCGMGLVSLEERTYSLGGSIKISHENGFQIFIQVPQFLPETQGKAKE